MSTVLATNYSKSNPNKQYEIVLANDGETVYCNCPGWKMSKDDPKMCRHLREFATGQTTPKPAMKTTKVTTDEKLQEAIDVAVGIINGRKKHA